MLHIKLVHDKNLEYVCEQCGKKFDCNGRLKAHVNKTHLKIEKAPSHFCDQCQFAADSKRKLVMLVDLLQLSEEWLLMYHFRQHHKTLTLLIDGGQNLFFFCFSHKVEKHGLEKEHLCSACPRSFATNGQLLNHVYSVHKNTNVTCQECGRHFNKLTRFIPSFAVFN